MNAQVVERSTLENDLRLALNKQELFLVYQPQMDVSTERITGLEALLRWQHPELGLVPPDNFIRIAENCGLILPIGEWVLRTACSQARKWQDEGLPAVTIAVNVSAVQFRQEGFGELVRKVLRETGRRHSSAKLPRSSCVRRWFILEFAVAASDDNSTAAVPLTQGCNAVPNRENELGWRLSSPSPRRSTACISCRNRRDTDSSARPWGRCCRAEYHFAQARPSASRPASISFTLQSLIRIEAIWWLAEHET